MQISKFITPPPIRFHDRKQLNMVRWMEVYENRQLLTSASLQGQLVDNLPCNLRPKQK